MTLQGRQRRRKSLQGQLTSSHLIPPVFSFHTGKWKVSLFLIQKQRSSREANLADNTDAGSDELHAGTVSSKHRPAALELSSGRETHRNLKNALNVPRGSNNPRASLQDSCLEQQSCPCCSTSTNADGLHLHQVPQVKILEEDNRPRPPGSQCKTRGSRGLSVITLSKVEVK